VVRRVDDLQAKDVVDKSLVCIASAHSIPLICIHLQLIFHDIIQALHNIFAQSSNNVGESNIYLKRPDIGLLANWLLDHPHIFIKYETSAGASVTPLSLNNIQKLLSVFPPLQLLLEKLERTIVVRSPVTRDVWRNDHIIHIP